MRTILPIAAILAVLAAALFVYFEKPEWIGMGEQSSVTGPAIEPGMDAPDAAELLPAFDIVRISEDATAVIAGRAQSGSTVTILRDGKPIGEVVAEQSGEWVLTIDTPLAPGSSQLSLKSVLPDGSVSMSVGEVAITIPEGAGEAFAVLLRPGEPSIVLQGLKGDAKRLVTIETIDYDQDGNVIIAGRGIPGHTARVYLDNQPVGDALVDEDGRWVLRPEGEISAGIYQLRADLLTPEGKIAERAQVPFKRESVDRLVFRDGRVVIQPGNTLWRVAREVYGSGFSYTIIYRANDDQIRDPDLIYPGQIFSLPGEVIDADAR